MTKIIVQEQTIKTLNNDGIDYICITDIARLKKTEDPNAVIGNWMRNRNTIEFLGIWESLYNPSFNPIEFEGFRKEAGLNIAPPPTNGSMYVAFSQLLKSAGSNASSCSMS